jgi:predicted RecA/RadA family phage recombinase
MATSQKYDGKVVNYANSSGSTITSGTVVEFATGRIGVALADIADSATGPIAVEGVWTLAKSGASITFTQGQSAVYLVTGGVTLTTVTTGNTLLNGWPHAASTTAETTVDIRLY